MKIALQVLGVIVLILGVAMATLRLANMNADGPSRLFPGGKLVSGELYTGPEPDWSFTDDIPIIELQLDDPVGSRLVFVVESEGKIYVPSGYMRSTLGRLWKQWAVDAVEGDGLAVVRIDGKRYERKLVRLIDGPALDGAVGKLASKYGDSGRRERVTEGYLWIFELAPRG